MILFLLRTTYISYFTFRIFCGKVVGLLFTRLHTDKEVSSSVLLGC